MNAKSLEGMTFPELEALRTQLEKEVAALRSEIDVARTASDEHCTIKDAFHSNTMRPLEKELLAITKATATGKEPSRPFKEAFDEQRAMMLRFDEMCIKQLEHYHKLSCLYDQAQNIDMKIDEVERLIRIQARQGTLARAGVGDADHFGLGGQLPF